MKHKRWFQKEGFIYWLVVALILAFYLICFLHLSKKVKSYEWPKEPAGMVSERVSDGD